MSNFFQSVGNILSRIKARYMSLTAPIRQFVNNVLAPVRRFFSPVTTAWANFTAPVRTRWANFKAKYPIPGQILGWTGRIFRWGFNFLLILVIGVWIGLFGALPSSEELKNIETANASEVYTADGVMIGKYYIENRTAISIENVSPYIINALIATEDHRFLEHSGIDLFSWVRVVKGMITRQDNLGGGSTLSQQLAKNLYPRKAYLQIKTESRIYKIPVISNAISLLINKIRENFISIRLERVYTKQELLNLYLNTVPFGGDIFGINVASRQYFNKKPKDLSVDQAAVLVGMLKGTTLYNPVRNPENAKKRRNVVLRQMVRNGHITEAEFKTLSEKPVGAKRYNVDSNNDGLGTYFREYLRTDAMRKILENNPREDGSKYNLYTDGLKIYTTLNSKMQKFAEESTIEQLKKLQSQFDKHWKNYKEKPWGDDKWIEEQIRRSSRWDSYIESGLSPEDARKEFEKKVNMTIFSWQNGGSDRDTSMTPLDSVRYYFCLLNSGFMAMEHKTGYVRAWVGGTNFKYFKFDHILSKRQVGSTFKPIVYAAALQDSIKPCQYFPNQIKMIVDWEPHNADERYGGWYSMSGALTKSVNVVAAQLIEKVGIQKTIDLAAKMGVNSKLPREFGISLGACDVALYDMMKVYGTIANEGKRPDPVVILKVVNRHGEVIYDYEAEQKPKPTEALGAKEASIMSEMMQNVINYGTGRRLRQYVPPDADFAGKTGTTQNHSDGWFICFNPELVTGAWVGAESPAVRFRSMDLGQGSAMALPIVGGFWNRIAKDGVMNKMFQAKFPDPKPEVQGLLGCYPWIGIKPDSFNVLMQDSTYRDSIQNAYQNRGVVDQQPGGEGDGAPEEGGNAPEKDGEQKQGLFKRLFGHKQEDQQPKDKEKEKEKKGNKPGGR